MTIPATSISMNHSKVINRIIELMILLTWKETSARYKHTLFGFMWIVANPFLQMVIIMTVVSHVLKYQISHYPLYLFIGLMAWNFFSQSLSKATPIFLYERNLIKKSAFPTFVIPLSIVMATFLHYCFGSLIFIIPWALATQPLPAQSVLLFVLSMIWLLMVTSGIALLTSTFNVIFRDVHFFVQSVLTLWFYATPVMYPIDSLPARIQNTVYFNPLFSILQTMTAALISGKYPSVNAVLINSVQTIFIVIAGIAAYRQHNRQFDDWL